MFILHTYAFLTFLFLSEVYDLFQLMCVLSCIFICFPSEVIFRSRVIGACPVTTDCIAAMSSRENMYQYEASVPVRGISRRCSQATPPLQSARYFLSDVLPNEGSARTGSGPWVWKELVESFA